jgi:hypothetical protein
MIDRPRFTTYAAKGWTSSIAAIKGVRIARNAIIERMAHSTSRSRRYLAHNSYDDKSVFLSSSLVHARANYGWVNYACDRERFEIRVFAGQQRNKQPLVTVKERHPLGSEPPRLDKEEIVAVLDRWLEIMTGGDESSPHEGWTRATRYVGAMARQNGALDDLELPHVLVLPSAYEPGCIQLDRKLKHRDGVTAGLALDLSPQGEIGRMVASLCHTSRVITKCIDHKGDTRVECDLSAPISLKMTIPDAMSALRDLVDAERNPKPGIMVALAA